MKMHLLLELCGIFLTLITIFIIIFTIFLIREAHWHASTSAFYEGLRRDRERMSGD